ncbi:MAG: C_GCAxxG_C_C family protein [Gammaproteobacteria bacterium]|nr:C_GCAxxG_C_C family protein [Gammaproteobacteria bacterium]MBL6998638.1 C_GCAxxG_C_C family protein [Gammaproteobacteria bacterium]
MSMKQTQKPSIKSTAEHYFNEGFCCSEAIVLATVDHYQLPHSAQLAQASASGLCGGMGGQQASCGVFTGGALAIGLVMAKGVKKDARIKALSAHYFEQLEQHAGGHQCQQLKKQMGLKNWNGSRCRQLTADGGAILQSILEAELSKK